ncbi:uncharacterized protein LOC134263246, partial [Saccostrea cucullata]|uniref:uncharacterized protein LOC134263246 n=1 Tax=Saccostrea cuccullata TaxID=36930 RepID=UPI002ED17A37
VPLIATALAPHIQVIIQSCLHSMSETIKTQQETIKKQADEIKSVQEINSDLEKRVNDLECGLDDLEQYGRRTCLRFHNVNITNEQAQNTDDVVIDICKTMGVNIVPDDINRSHPIGRPNSNNLRQVICRFRSWKIKNKIYSAKKNLKDNPQNPSKIFVTEDLTKYRQLVVKKIIEAKKANKLHSFWTYDGRIYIKTEKEGDRIQITSLDDLYELIE